MGLLYFFFFALVGSSSSINTVEGLRAQKVVGGTWVRKNDFKYVVAVMYKVPGFPNQNPCSGTILSDFFIATIAHCFYDKIFGEWRRRHFFIAAALNNILEPFIWTRYIGVDIIIIPKRYNPDNPDNYTTEANLAMVKVAESLQLDKNKEILSKLTPRSQDFRNLEDSFLVAGFGFDEVIVSQQIIHGELHNVQDGKSSGKLFYAKVKLLAHKNCENILGDRIAAGNMCAKAIRLHQNSPTGICKYDSGAPLKHQFYLDGIAINGGLSCDEEQTPGFYINVLEYSTFIAYVINGCTSDEDMRILQLRKKRGEYKFKEIGSQEFNKIIKPLL